MDSKRATAAKGSGEPAGKAPTAQVTNFLRNIIAEDLARGTYEGRRWRGAPAPYDRDAPTDAARIRTRFPPEPNGYLHIGHAKSICLNFGLARDFQGRCHMRFDDTNPVREDQEYVDGILETVRWIGFDWDHDGESNLYHASDYFDLMYACAEHLIRTGYAYVDAQSADEMRASRGTLTEPGRDSPHRDRPVEDNVRLFREMRSGLHAEGTLILRARIDMRSPNINLRDPAIYRIRFAEHHRTGNHWCIYPMYAYAHPLEDCVENITHSICTLEFEDQRPFYDWVLQRCVPVLRAAQLAVVEALLVDIAEAGGAAQLAFAMHCADFAQFLGHSAAEQRAAQLFASWHADVDLAAHGAVELLLLLRANAALFTPLLQHALDERQPNPFVLPHQYEFNRLAMTYIVTSKRKLLQLVEEKHVNGWDDPRMPTLVGLRRRGYTPESIQLLMDRVGVSKSPQWIDYALLEQALRDDLDARAPRATAVLRPLKLIIDNLSAIGLSDGEAEDCVVPVHPQHPAMGSRTIRFMHELWIEQEDFNENPGPGYFRLSPPQTHADGSVRPGSVVRLRYAYVVRCTGVEKDHDGRILAVHAELLPETRSGGPGANSVKTKAAIHWLPVAGSVPAQVRLYDRLFTDPHPDSGGKDFLAALNPNSLTVLDARVEAALANAPPDSRFQFERNGYFVADRKDHQPQAPVFNLAVSLKDAWGKAG